MQQLARKLLNYKTKTSLEEGIKKTYEYIKSRGVRPFDYNIDIEIKNELTPKTWTEKEIQCPGNSIKLSVK